MVKIIEKYIPKSQKKQRPGYAMTPKYITVHQTANTNKGTNAEMHSRYLLNGASGRTVVWHYTVDDNPEIYQHLPTNECGWHAGDGTNGTGNRQSIGIEICENSDGNFAKAVANAVWLIKKLMKEHNIPIENVVPHKRWSGKNCPSKLLNYWDDFIGSIGIVEKNEVVQVSKPKPQPTPTKPTVSKPSVPASIVDWMNINKMDSSFANRAKLAKQHGFRDYRGTADQNVALLSMLQSSKSVSSKPKPSTVNVKTDSIVDWLNANKMDSSFSARAKLAQKHGIKNYRGTAAQNISLLNKLRK